jgi:hypothetical protein
MHPGMTTEAQTENGEQLEAHVEQLLENGNSYVDDVIALYEASERNYRAAMTAGTVVNGFSDSTNY